MKEETRLLRSVRIVARCVFLGHLPKGLREDIPDKYILTQLSGATVGIVVPIFAMFYFKPFGIDLALFHNPNQPLSKFIAVIAILWALFFASIYLWGKVLVLLGVLKWEEAKGYPFSKPWVNTTNNNT